MTNTSDSIEVKARDVSFQNYGNRLASIFTSKLPDEIRSNISRNATAKIQELNGLLYLFKKELQTRGRCACGSESRTDKKDDKDSNENPFVASSLTAFIIYNF